MGVLDIFDKGFQLLLWMLNYPITIEGLSFSVMDGIIFFGILGAFLFAISALFDW